MANRNIEEIYEKWITEIKFPGLEYFFEKYPNIYVGEDRVINDPDGLMAEALDRTEKYKAENPEEYRKIIKYQNRLRYQKNKEKIKEKNKEYYEKNKEKINEKITCPCGSVVSKKDIRRHERTKKHQQWEKKI